MVTTRWNLEKEKSAKINVCQADKFGLRHENLSRQTGNSCKLLVIVKIVSLITSPATGSFNTSTHSNDGGESIGYSFHS